MYGYLTQEQFKGMTERFVTVMSTMLLALFVRRGWIGEGDAATLLPAIVLLPSLIYGWWINRNKALAQATAAIPGTVVITQAGIASSTKESNIVSNVDNTVVTKPTEGK